jgi:hypothetical protein
MSVIHPHFQDFWDNSPIELALWWYFNSELFLRCLTQPKYHKPLWGSNLSGNLIIYPPKCDIKEEKMNGRKPKQPVARFSDSNAQPSPLRWINIPLTDKDIALLEGETASLEQLAFAFVSLGMHGLGLSIKYDSTRKSYNCSIYGPDLAANMQPCGVSGAAPDLRDALLVSLFRFNSCLQGSFDGQSAKNPTVQSRRFG